MASKAGDSNGQQSGNYKNTQDAVQRRLCWDSTDFEFDTCKIINCCYATRKFAILDK